MDVFSFATSLPITHNRGEHAGARDSWFGAFKKRELVTELKPVTELSELFSVPLRDAVFYYYFFSFHLAAMLTVNLSGSRCPGCLVFRPRLSMTNSRALNSKVYLLSRAAHSLSTKINLSGLFSMTLF